MINGLNKADKWGTEDYEREYKIASKCSCPFAPSKHSIKLPIDKTAHNTVPVGLAKDYSFDHTWTKQDFCECIGTYCMAYDIETRTCKRCNP